VHANYENFVPIKEKCNLKVAENQLLGQIRCTSTLRANIRLSVFHPVMEIITFI
jgi:hypothetical protein